MAGGVLLAPGGKRRSRILRALVLSDHALDLAEQVLFGAAARRIAQEDDLDAAAGELLQDQDSGRHICERNSVRIEDVEAIEDAGGGLVAKSLEARADQGIPAVAVVHEARLGLAFQRRHSRRGRRTASSWLAIVPSYGLLVPGDAGIDLAARRS